MKDTECSDAMTSLPILSCSRALIKLALPEQVGAFVSETREDRPTADR